MSRPQPRELTVESVIELTPNMRRIVLTGEALADFPADSKSGYVKLQFDQQGRPLDAAALAQFEGRPQMRSYTVRQIDVENRLLTLDMVLHGDGDASSGPAAHWAASAQPGDVVMVGGPGPTKLIAQPADYYFLVGDMTALPAIAANLEELPEESAGIAIIEIASPDDVQHLICPKNIHIEWVVADNHKDNVEYQQVADNSLLVTTATQQNWPDSDVSVWAACEFHKMRSLRRYFRDARGLNSERLYISSYWKLDRTDEQHKQDKKTDPEA